jgi:transposase InsO family protein
MRDQRISFISDVLNGSYAFSVYCRDYGISRKTGYKWFKRYREEGFKGLQDRSRCPHSHPHQLSGYVRQEILRLKTKHSCWGAPKIRQLLKVEHPDWQVYPAESTIGRFLRDCGLTYDRRRKVRAKPTSTPLTTGISANDVWSADFKGNFLTGDRHRCNPLTISDDASRYLLCCQHVDRMSFASVKQQYERVFSEYGLPLIMRTDNGVPFAGQGVHGLSRLNVWLVRLGIRTERIKPGHPEQNGRHERIHRTLKEYIQPVSKDLLSQQKVFDKFRYEYNNERPHESLSMATPAEYYSVSVRVFPSKLPCVDYGSFSVRKVASHGDIRYQGERYFLSEALGGQEVGLEQISERSWRVYFCTLLLGVIDTYNRRFTAYEQ